MLQNTILPSPDREFYLFNYVPRFIFQLFRTTLANCAAMQINKNGKLCLSTTLDYLMKELSFVKTAPQGVDWLDMSFNSEFNEYEKSAYFLTLLSAGASELPKKLKSKYDFSSAEITLILKMKTEQREPIDESKIKEIKKLVKED